MKNFERNLFLLHMIISLSYGVLYIGMFQNENFDFEIDNYIEKKLA